MDFLRGENTVKYIFIKLAFVSLMFKCLAVCYGQLLRDLYFSVDLVSACNEQDVTEGTFSWFCML